MFRVTSCPSSAVISGEAREPARERIVKYSIDLGAGDPQLAVYRFTLIIITIMYLFRQTTCLCVNVWESNLEATVPP